MRVSSHRLCIETGRWTKPNRTPVNERICTLCNKLEDEFHFIIECTRYVDLRKQFIKQYYWVRPSMHKFIELMKSDNKNVIRKLGIYIERAFHARNNALYN